MAKILVSASGRALEWQNQRLPLRKAKSHKSLKMFLLVKSDSDKGSLSPRVKKTTKLKCKLVASINKTHRRELILSMLRILVTRSTERLLFCTLKSASEEVSVRDITASANPELNLSSQTQFFA